MANNKKSKNQSEDVQDLNRPLTPEEESKARVQLRENLRERFSKWMDVLDDEPTKEDIDREKDAWKKEVESFQNNTYRIADSDALAFAEMLREWNRNYGVWQKGAWKSIITFEKRINEIIDDIKSSGKKTLEVDYATLFFLYQTLNTPSGQGIESAKAMAILENYDPDEVKPLDNGNYVTYSHILQNVLERIAEFEAVDKMLKLKHERINMMIAGIHTEWKISEVEEFVELNNTWIGQSLPENDERLKQMAN